MERETRAPNLKSRPSLNIETYSPAYRGVSTFDHFIFFERPQAPGGEDRFRASFYVNTREPRN